MVPIGLAAAAAVVAVVIGLSLIGQPKQKVGDPSAVPNPTQVAPTPPVSSSATGRMAILRQGHDAVLLADGRVLVHGGSAQSSSSDAARLTEIYDPESGRWTATGSTMIERPTLTLLADGRVLATGGQEPGDNGAPVASAELYDPRTGEWSATGSMIAARSGHTATLLADGTVLVAGSWGQDGVANADASAELYDPITGTWSATGSMVEPRSGHTATLLRTGRCSWQAEAFGLRGALRPRHRDVARHRRDAATPRDPYGDAAAGRQGPGGGWRAHGRTGPRPVPRRIAAHGRRPLRPGHGIVGSGRHDDGVPAVSRGNVASGR